MATYQGARFIREQLDSLANQTTIPLELQIGDEGSTDGTQDIIRDFARDAPFPVELHQNSQRLGFGENFIRTALRCKGSWIAFCDQDDVWLPHKLNWAANQIQQAPVDLALIAHNARIVDEHLQPMRLLYQYPEKEVATPLQLPPEWYCIGATQVFRAELLRSIPCSPRVSFPWHPHREAHDVWVALLANATGSILRAADALVLYRRHAQTVTETAAASQWRMQLQSNGDGYAARSDYLRSTADRLTDCAAAAGPPVATKLRSAADKLRVQAEFLSLRACAYEGGLGSRLQSIAALVRKGGYFGRVGWSFGGLRLIKDIAATVIYPNRK